MLALSLAVGFAGLAYAAIPDSQGVIHGCYRTNTGSLRIIDSDTDTCNGNETSLNWNQTGPQGLPGPQGPAGPSGASGYSGRVPAIGSSPIMYAGLIQFESTGTNRAGRDIISPPTPVAVSNFTAQLVRKPDFVDMEEAYAPGTGNTHSLSLVVGNTAFALCSISDSSSFCQVTSPGITIPANSQIALKLESTCTSCVTTQLPVILFHLETE